MRHLRRIVAEFRMPRGGGRTVTGSREACTAGVNMNRRRLALTPNDVTFLQYTGGNTDLSKEATLSHRDVLVNILQTEA